LRFFLVVFGFELKSYSTSPFFFFLR
jgi:hypothetical protein